MKKIGLLIFSLFGGSIGSIIGMMFFHHKTLKLKFWFINILFFLIYFFTLTSGYLLKNIYI